MKIKPARQALCVLCCSLIVVAACFAQKANDWAMTNAMIGPDSPIELRAGSSYQAQAMYPVPDGPLFPLKASVAWSIAPVVKGISIDAKTGKIIVDADVPHGVTATVHANVENGRRALTAKLYVFRPEENPLVGKWHVDQKVSCGETEEMKVPELRPHALHDKDWKFHADQQFWVGKEMNIAAGVWLAGAYELDQKTAKIKLNSTWPKKSSSTWNYLLRDSGKTLILRPVEDQDDLEHGCGYVLLR